ncbi:glycosyltransferase [Massilia niastensis]|uniref:glycosyltransferase n=1 Tax=Massilia niastensis TaxID=544911 RepID=UPI00038006D6|nr:nucleotide disphospho-sugar-binding domain-containing protein [Massilia niastensis]
MSRSLHFILVTIGSAGDLFPFLWMGTALRARGHRVDFLGPDLHAPFVAQAGLPFHGLPADPAVLDHPDLWHPTRGLAVVWQATRPAMAAVPAVVAALPPGGPRVLLAHPLALPEADLCRARQPGLKIAAAYLAPSNLPTVHDPLLLGPWPVPRWVPHGVRRWLWRQAGARLIDPVALPDVNAARAAHGLAPARELIALMTGIPDLSLTLFPEWFAPSQPDWPRPLAGAGFPLYDPNPAAALGADLRAFLDAGAAPVAFTPGTGNRQADRYFAAAAQAVGRLGLRAIFLTPHREQLPARLPEHILWQDYVPLKALLPRVAALVHHGGIGTTAEALRAGTPQLVVPLAHDQFDNAARVRLLGAGATLHATRVTPARMARALLGVVGEGGMARRCREVSALLAAPSGIDALCERLEALAGV